MKIFVNSILIFVGFLFPLTFIHVLISWFFKIDINYLTLCAFSACILFIILNSSRLSGITQNKLWPTLFIFLLIVPLFIAVFTFRLNIFKYLAQVSYLVLIAATYIISRSNSSLKILRGLIIAAIILNVVLALMNLLNPGFFRYLSYSLQNTTETGDRASGLFLQPNTMGLSMVLIYLITGFLFKERASALLAVVILIGVFITGSRTAVLGFSLVLIVKIFSGRHFFMYLLKYYLPAAVMGFIIFYTASESIFPQMISHKDNNFYARIEKIFESNAYDYQTDGSIRARNAYQQVYIDAIILRPIAGHGFKTQQDFLSEGKIWGSAHNIFLELLYLGGIIYLFSFAGVVFKLYSYAKFYRSQSRELFNGTIQLLFFLFFVAFFSTTILENRLLYIAFGLVLSIPNLVKPSEVNE